MVCIKPELPFLKIGEFGTHASCYEKTNLFLIIEYCLTPCCVIKYIQVRREFPDGLKVAAIGNIIPLVCSWKIHVPAYMEDLCIIDEKIDYRSDHKTV